jgi:glycosyltransferase involved in cell wall biosynthesis
MADPLRILWLKTGPLHPLDSGGKLRTYHMLRELSREHAVTYLSLCPPEEAGAFRAAASDRQTEAPSPDKIDLAAAEYSQRQTWIPWRETPRRSLRFLSGVAGNFLGSRLPYVIAKYRSQAMAAAIREEDASRRHDLIVCDFLTPAVNLFTDSRPPVTPTLLFAHNVETLIWQRLAENARGLRSAYFRGQSQRMLRFERAAGARCSGVVSVSDADALLFRAQLGLENVLGSVPTGVDVDFFSAIPPIPQPGSLVFLGSMDWMPNIDGALWFAAEIWPGIKARAPGATLSIVGRRPSPAVRELAAADPSIRVTGTVEDVRPYLAQAEALVVPLRVGGGTRIKIYEGMAAGVPVISTSIGAEGLSVRDGENILLADVPEDFARKTADLLADPARRASLGQSGRALVREHFSWHSVTAVFAGYCRAVSQQPRSPH